MCVCGVSSGYSGRGIGGVVDPSDPTLPIYIFMYVSPPPHTHPINHTHTGRSPTPGGYGNSVIAAEGGGGEGGGEGAEMGAGSGGGPPPTAEGKPPAAYAAASASSPARPSSVRTVLGRKACPCRVCPIVPPLMII